MSTSRVWISAIRCGSCGGFGFAQQRVALEIGLEHDVDQAFRPVGRFLREAADAPARRDGDGAGFGRQFAADRVKQRRFADAVAADQADARAGHDLHRAVVDQKPSGDPDRDVGDGKHAALSPEPAAKRNPFIGKIRLIGGLRRSMHARCRAGAAHPSAAADRGDEVGLGAQVLLQPFADGVADRPAWSCDRSVRNRC